jgi:hypothetical protein
MRSPAARRGIALSNLDVRKTHTAPRGRPRGAGKPDAPTKSDQSRLTPPEFLDAVERRFGPLVFDLAAERGKSVRGLPCFTKEDDALSKSWRCIQTDAGIGTMDLEGVRWLNPPFGMFTEFAAQAAAEATARHPVLFLSLASVDSNWYWDHVFPNAISWAIDRIQFVGETHPFPKPLMLSYFGLGGGFGIQRWRWKASSR